jgi:hypothetical protein
MPLRTVFSPALMLMVELEAAPLPPSVSTVYEWTRNCPQCGVWLHKANPQDAWVCECGWRSP